MSSTQLQAQELLEQILAQGRALLADGKSQIPELTTKGKALAKQGEDVLIDKLGMDDTEAIRAKIRKQAKYAGAAGAIALLLQSRSARKLATLGGLGALGMVAYRAHQRGAMPKDFNDAIGLLKGDAGNARAEVLLKAMVAAAKADGRIDAEEQALIDAHEGASNSDLQAILDTPASAKVIASMAKSDQMAAEIYAVSCRVANGLNPKERDYLDQLAMAMRLDPEAAAQIETEMRTG
ncbi:DUF533 domain-containing protein [Litorimonas sp. RW-G-Af-16]|uniref:DUF533 domain-containing protein n=1 Tax=Litorimonas sp. RW-G-Af-16 TaxID=3241168 RepID=UPI00390CADAB